jgi:imidazoleglycerol phosphate dehydratase HisB
MKSGNDSRAVEIKRRTAETDITLRLDPDGSGRTDIATGLGFLDHMLDSLAFHAGWDLELSCRGDLQVDDHHSAEDCAICLGLALQRIIKEGPPVARFGWALVPMDEALARVSIDLGGRPWTEIQLGLQSEKLGQISTQNITHVLQSLALEARANLHVDLLKGFNDHHRAEAAFKGLAQALRQALRPVAGNTRSTKEMKK